MAPTNWSNNPEMRHQERFAAKVEVSFLSFGNNCLYRIIPHMPPSAYSSRLLISGFLRGMQLILAPLFCLLGEEPEEELNPASLEQPPDGPAPELPSAGEGCMSYGNHSCQAAPKLSSKIHTHRKTPGRCLSLARLFWMLLSSP